MNTVSVTCKSNSWWLSHSPSAEKGFSQIDGFHCHTNLCTVKRVSVMTPGALLALFVWECCMKWYESLY